MLAKAILFTYYLRASQFVSWLGVFFHFSYLPLRRNTYVQIQILETLFLCWPQTSAPCARPGHLSGITYAVYIIKDSALITKAKWRLCK